MQIPIISRSGQKQPYGSIPRINWNHPLARGLLFYHYDGGGSGARDLARNRVGSQSGTQQGRQSTPWGTGYAYDGGGSNGVTYVTDAALRTQPAMSWGCGFQRTAIPTEGGPVVFGRAANNFASQPFANWGFSFDASTASDIAPVVNNGGTIIGPPSTVISNNTFYTAVAIAPGATILNWWLNGIPQSGLSTINIQSVTSGDNIYIGTDKGGPGGFQGNMYWAAFWGRALNQAEARQLHDDPYCFLIYPEDEMFASLAAAAANAAALAARAVLASFGGAGPSGGATLSAKATGMSKAKGGISTGAILQALLGSGVAQFKSKAGIAGQTLIAGLTRSTSFARGVSSNKAGLAAKTPTTSASRATVSALSALAGRAAAQSMAAGATVGKVALAAKATAAAFGRLTQPGALQLIGNAVIRSFARLSAPNSTAALAAKATAASFGRISPPGAIQLLAAAFMQMFGRAAPTTKTQLQGKSVLTLQSTSSGSFTQKLLGSTRVQLTSLAKATSTAGMAATSAVKVFGRLVPPTGKTALAGATRAAAAIRGGISAVSPMVSLQAQTFIKSVVSGLLTAFGLSPRVATAVLQVRSVDAPYEIRSADAPAEVRSVDAPSLT